MYTVEDMRLNTLEDVYIPSAKDMFLKFGFRQVADGGNVGSDGEFAEPVNKQDTVSKIDAVRLGFDELQSMARAKEEQSEAKRSTVSVESEQSEATKPAES